MRRRQQLPTLGLQLLYLSLLVLMSLMRSAVGSVSCEVTSFEAWKPSRCCESVWIDLTCEPALCRNPHHPTLTSTTTTRSLKPVTILSNQYLFRTGVLGLLSTSLFTFMKGSGLWFLSVHLHTELLITMAFSRQTSRLLLPRSTPLELCGDADACPWRLSGSPAIWFAVGMPEDE